MRALLDIYIAQFKVTAATQLQYRVSMVIWLISTILEPVIYLVVWATVARSQGGSVGGYSASAFAAYYIVLMMVNHVGETWVFWEFADRVRRGTFSPLLLRPVHPIHADIAENASYKTLTLVVVIPVVAILTLAFHPVLSPAPWEIVAFVPALLIAAALRFTVEWTIAMSSFWVTRTDALNQVYYVALLFFSGQAAPLALFPQAFQVVASLLPFRWVAAFPVELLLGKLSPIEIAEGFAAQVIWLGISYAALRVIWKAGTRKYSAVGA